jgi:hypothetical protein
MKIFIQILVLIVLIAVFSSCTTTLYTSNTVNTPLLKQQGEVQISATPNDLQTAFAVTDHVGIMANGFYRTYKKDNYQHTGQLFEVGVGKYHPRIFDLLIFETYTGVGLGKVYKQQEFAQQDNSTQIGSFSANGAKIFFQPSIGVGSKFIDVALTPRFSLVKYTNFSSTNYPDANLQDDYLYDDELTRGAYLLADPALTVRAGYKFIKLQFQYGQTLNLGKRIKHNTEFSSLGVMFDIGAYRTRNTKSKPATN